MTVEKPTSLLNLLRQTGTLPDAPGVQDAELLERFVRQRDEMVFELLVWRHERLVWGVCRRVLQQRCDAEDAFQATFLILARKASAISRRESLAGWLYRVALRCALKLRAAGARQTRTEPTDFSAIVADPCWNEVERQDLRRVLDEEIQRLPAKQQEAIVLCYLEGKTYQEAATQLGCPVGTLSARLTAARDRLRARLTARGLALTGAVLAAGLCEQAACAGADRSLAERAIQAVWADGKGPATSGLARAAALAEGVVKAMSVSKFKLAALVLLLAGLFGIAGFVVSGGKGAAKPRAEPPAPVRVEGVPVWQQCARLGGSVSAYPFTYGRFSPDSRTLLTVDAKNVYRLWDTADWKLRGTFDAGTHYGESNALLGRPLSPDGRLLALSGSIADPEKPGQRKPEVTLLDAGTLRQASRLPGNGPLFCPDQTALLTWGGDQVSIWDARTFGKKFDLKAAGEVRGLEATFSRDGALLFVPTKTGPGHLWEMQTGKERARLEGFQPRFAANGQVLLTHLAGGVVKLWDTGTGRKRAELKPLPGAGCWVEFLADGKYVLGSPATSTLLKPNGDLDLQRRNGPIKPRIRPVESRLWDLEGKEVARLPGMDPFETYARPSPDGKTVGYLRLEPEENERRELVLWDVAGNKERAVIRAREGVHYFEFSPDGGTVFTLDPELATFKLWDSLTGRRLPDLGKVSLTGLQFSPDGKLFVATEGKMGEVREGPADLLVFRLSAQLLPPPVQRAEPAGRATETPVEPAKPKLSPAAQALADLRKEHQAADRRMKFAASALRIARDHPRDPAALEALEVVLQALAGDYGQESDRLREEAFGLVRKEFLKSPELSRLLFYLRYQRTESAEALLQTIAEDSPDRVIRGRALLHLAEALSEKTELSQLLRLMPELLKHPEVKHRAERLRPLLQADPDALARRAEQWWQRIKEQYADVLAQEGSDRKLGPEAESGLFALRELSLGKAAPEIQGADLEGKQLQLSDSRGKVVVLIFSGHWCGPCRQMHPELQKLLERMRDRPFALLEVNSDEDSEAVKRTMAREKLTWRCWFEGGREGTIARRWHVHTWPTILVLDAKGIIRYKELRGDVLDRAVEGLLAEMAK